VGAIGRLQEACHLGTLVESNEFMSETQKLTPDVSVVVPVRNEAGNVAPLVLEIASALSGRAFEIIYVNDGSSDGTEVELIELAASRAWLRQIKHEASCGQSAAVRTGVIHARAPVVVTLEVSVAHCQWGSQRSIARWHPRYRLRPQGVSPRCFPGAALF
jgi:hypothetical protein